MRCPRQTPRSRGPCWLLTSYCSPTSTRRSNRPLHLARLLPTSPFAPLLTVPGWGPARTGNYGGALGDPARFDNHRQVYRTAGLNPIQYESAGKRRDSVISREGSVELRRALIDLGIGLWLTDPAAKTYGSQLRDRGKKGMVIACAMAHRANRIAFALVRDQTDYDPARWAREED
jgi:transposase